MILTTSDFEFPFKNNIKTNLSLNISKQIIRNGEKMHMKLYNG